MEFEENNITQSHTGSEIESYEKLFYDDGELDGYMLSFKDGYKLSVDRNDVTEKDLKWMIDNNIYVDIDFRLCVWKGRIPNSESVQDASQILKTTEDSE